MSHPPAILGINFGQSYASIAVIDKEGHASCIANEEGERQIACAVSYNGEEVYIGNGAKPQLVKNGKNTIMGFRNLLGHTYDEVDHTAILAAPLIADSKTPAYTVDILIPAPAPTPAQSGRTTAANSGAATPAPREPIQSTKTITVPEITTLFLRTLFQSATDFLGVKPSGAVVSAPSWFTQDQEKALKAAAEDAGIHVLQVLDETAAVLVGYRATLSEERKERGLLGKPEEGDAGKEEARDKKIVVVDVGETSLSVTAIAAAEGQYTLLAADRDSKLGGREFDNLLLKHFAKEFTKKTKVALDVPCTESASSADKRAEAKLRLAVEHTKRSLSASSGAATCAVESLKDGYDLSGAINRMRFDGLAAGVYRQVGAKVAAVVEKAGLELTQVDEILLAGASTLFPGLQAHLALLVAPTTPVTAAMDPAEVIAIGCALQALHLATLPEELKLQDILAQPTRDVETVAQPIALVLPGSSDELVAAKIIESGSPLPVRRRVAIPLASGTKGKVAFELWEAKDSVNVEKVERAPVEKDEDDEEFSDEEEEDDEIKTAVTKKTTLLTAVEVESHGADKIILEVVVLKGGKLEARAWAEGKEAEATTVSV